MQNQNQSRRHQPAGLPPSPRLLKSKSQHPVTPLLPDIRTNRPSSSPTAPLQRSKSTTNSSRTQAKKRLDEENINPYSMMTSRRPGLPRKSPSAWALSPGRSLPSPPVLVPKSPSSGKSKKEMNGGVSTVLKYFRQKKVSQVQAGEFHQFRIMQNRLLQWRFVNARAQASMASLNKLAKDKFFNVWLHIYLLGNLILEKRVKLQKLKDEIKLYRIVKPQACLLKEWATKLEMKNTEAVGKLTRKLSAISIRVPLIQGAKGNVFSVVDAMMAAMEPMDSVEKVAEKFLPQMENVCFLTTEVAVMEKQQKEYMDELQKWVSTVSLLQAKEASLTAHFVQRHT